MQHPSLKKKVPLHSTKVHPSLLPPRVSASLSHILTTLHRYDTNQRKQPPLPKQTTQRPGPCKRTEHLSPQLHNGVNHPTLRHRNLPTPKENKKFREEEYQHISRKFPTPPKFIQHPAPPEKYSRVQREHGALKAQKQPKRENAPLPKKKKRCGTQTYTGGSKPNRQRLFWVRHA